jgi:hypothetical protein
MKKNVLPFFSILLVLTLTLSSFSSAAADYSDDPWVNPVSGDMEFDTTSVPPSALPGTIELANQMLVPASFPKGETQFGGNGVRITGFDGGKATVCYSLKASEVAYGWGGKIGSWDGTKWVLLPTSIAPVPEEASATSACATITGSGTYAFIKYVVETGKLPKDKCAFDVFVFPSSTYTGYIAPYDYGTFIGFYFLSGAMHEGMEVTLTSLYSVPTDYMIVTGVGTGTTIEVGPGIFYVPFITPMQYSLRYDVQAWYFQVSIDGCVKDLNWPDDYKSPFSD